MHAFVLAGGFATRLWPLTEQRAKPLLPLAGKPLLTHIVEKIPEPIPVTVSTNVAFGDSMQEWARTLNRPNLRVRIEHTRNDDEKLGTLGAAAQWITQDKIDDDVLLLTGDNYFGFSLNTFVDQFGDAPLVAAYDIGDRAKASAFGTIVPDSDGTTIMAFEEKPKEPKSSLVSTGASILPRRTLPILIEFAKVKPDNVGGIFEELLRRNERIECFRFTEPWFDIGSFDAYLDATRTLVEAQCLQDGTTLVEDTLIEGSVVLGKNCIVKKSTLRDVVLFDNCTIEDCVLDNCIIDNECILKGIDVSGKMLRTGTRLIRE